MLSDAYFMGMESISITFMFYNGSESTFERDQYS